MPGAIAIFDSFLKVNPVQGNLILSSGRCGANGGLAIPSNYTSPGATNTDLVLFVTARPTNGRLLAYALECRSDQLGRAIAGQVNVAPAALEDASKIDAYIRIVVHEIIHVLGFSSAKFSQYINATTNTTLGTVTRTVTGPRAGTIKQIVTPNALAHARDFFGCQELGGVSLEDGGDAASANSHWEKRIFRDDLMGPSVVDNSVISKVTLGLLEDMGWYYPDYGIAETSLWGRNQGCQFPNGNCTDWTQPLTSCIPGPSPQPTCSYDRWSITYCAVVNYTSDLPVQYQWFSYPKSGGLDVFFRLLPLIFSVL
jgi:leishmanolysin